MAEVLGVVAAATQLTATCLAMMELTTSIKGGASAVRGFQKQLQELQSLADNISYNPLLQTPEVELHTRNLLAVLSHNNFDSLLQKRRVVRALLLLQQDRAITTFFEQLERRKTALCLVINDIQSRTLHQIQVDISTMADHEGPGNTRRREPTSRNEPTPRREPNPRSTDDFWSGALDPKREEAAFKAVQQYLNMAPSGSSVYIDNRAGDNVDMVLGTFYQGSGQLLQPLLDQERAATPSKRNIYHGCLKRGNGNLVLGSRYDLTKDSRVPPSVTTQRDIYTLCDYNPGVSEEEKKKLGMHVAGTMITQYLSLEDMRKQSQPVETHVYGQTYPREKEDKDE